MNGFFLIHSYSQRNNKHRLAKMGRSIIPTPHDSISDAKLPQFTSPSLIHCTVTTDIIHLNVLSSYFLFPSLFSPFLSDLEGGGRRNLGQELGVNHLCLDPLPFRV
jgi:hypothetical protein